MYVDQEVTSVIHWLGGRMEESTACAPSRLNSAWSDIDPKLKTMLLRKLESMAR